jgi:hypothetical protein
MKKQCREKPIWAKIGLLQVARAFVVRVLPGQSPWIDGTRRRIVKARFHGRLHDLVELATHNLVALACGLFEPRSVDNLNLAPPIVADRARHPELVQNQRHRRSPYPE